MLPYRSLLLIALLALVIGCREDEPEKVRIVPVDSHEYEDREPWAPEEQSPPPSITARLAGG